MRPSTFFKKIHTKALKNLINDIGNHSFLELFAEENQAKLDKTTIIGDKHLVAGNIAKYNLKMGFTRYDCFDEFLKTSSGPVLLAEVILTNGALSLLDVAIGLSAALESLYFALTLNSECFSSMAEVVSCTFGAIGRLTIAALATIGFAGNSLFTFTCIGLRTASTLLGNATDCCFSANADDAPFAATMN